MKTKPTKKITVNDLQDRVNEAEAKMTPADNKEMVAEAKAYLKANRIAATKENVARQIEAEHGKKVAKKATDKAPATKRNTPGEVFGFKSVAVARALGAAGLMPSVAIAAIHAFQPKNKRSSEAAIRTFVQAGKKGVRGDAAPLTKTQLKQLTAAGEEAAA